MSHSGGTCYCLAWVIFWPLRCSIISIRSSGTMIANGVYTLSVLLSSTSGFLFFNLLWACGILKAASQNSNKLPVTCTEIFNTLLSESLMYHLWTLLLHCGHWWIFTILPKRMSWMRTILISSNDHLLTSIGTKTLSLQQVWDVGWATDQFQTGIFQN